MLAWRNLVHDKMRFVVTVTGIAFAVVLIVVQLGVFLGFTTTTASLIDQSGADRWISAPDVPFIEQVVPSTERVLATVRATPGVARAGTYARLPAVGITRGVRALTTSPYVFATFETARHFPELREDQTMYLLVKAEPGVGIGDLRQRLAGRLTDVDVLTTAEFSRRARIYWTFTTGAGLALLLAAALGLIVGVVVVAQTIYATTADHLREYATLKAMGASNRYLYEVIVLQAVISGLIGYAIGMVIAVVVAGGGNGSGAAVVLTPGMFAGMLVLTLAMCVSGAMFSIRAVARLDPALVFKG